MEEHVLSVELQIKEIFLYKDNSSCHLHLIAATHSILLRIHGITIK